MSVNNNFIPYDRMKEQILKELSLLFESSKIFETIQFPEISFEKGSTHISFSIPPLTDSMLFSFLFIMKKHIENIRISSFDDGHYSFQALNSNIFKPDNILDNIKIEFFSLVNSKIIISKKGNFTQEEVNVVIEIFKNSHSSIQEDPSVKLKKLGATVMSGNSSLQWDYIAGYEEVKRKIRESIILPLQNSELYDSIAKMTRKVYESNRPRAILFDGPPGVGKTTVAKIISGEVNIPLVYVPIESITSKWFGQSSQNLSRVFDYCEEMGGAIIFLDEIDSLAGSRDKNMFEATRRILSVLLRKLDGIDAAANTITIGATNRKDDLDRALISRFDQVINFPMPKITERASIFTNYAKHLNEEEYHALGERSNGLSGRNIKDICEFTERRWARKVLVKKINITPPPIEYYKRSIKLWLNQE